MSPRFYYGWLLIAATVVSCKPRDHLMSPTDGYGRMVHTLDCLIVLKSMQIADRHFELSKCEWHMRMSITIVSFFV